METEVEVKRKGQNSNNLNHMKRGLYRPNDLPLRLAQYSTVRDIDEDRLTFSSVFPFSSALDPDLRGFYLRGAYVDPTPSPLNRAKIPRFFCLLDPIHSLCVDLLPQPGIAS